MKIFTIGYEGQKIENFVKFLNKNKIKIVIDVRQNPISRKPGFSKTKLSEHLAKKKIKYFHFKSLGVPSAWRKKAKHKMITREKMFDDYVAKILPGQVEVFQQIKKLALKNDLALMCYEADAADCHRRRITDKMKSKSTKIVDLKITT